MMKLSIHYPWEQTEKGQGFFIPCLDTDAVREAGLKESVKLRILDARATVGIRNGLMGVWFFRTGPRSP
jgi:hypothetical protein